VGRLYAISNNNPSLTGDGYALAYRAGAELVDMEFLQFEPFWVILPGVEASESNGTSFLLHDGPSIYNSAGEEFLPNRGIGLGKAELSRRIFQEVQAGKGSPNGGIYFDLTKVPEEKLKMHTRFMAFCRHAGLDLARKPLEVGPVQHHLMGGVRIDARTYSTVPGLFAAGEAAGGVHGADRLAANSGTDVLVFGARAGCFSAEYARSISRVSASRDSIAGARLVLDRFAGSEPLDMEKWIKIHTHLRRIMWDKAGIVREREGLECTLDAIGELRAEALTLKGNTVNEQVKILELENHLLLGEMIARSALKREESRGAHYRSDFPLRNDRAWLKNIVVYSKNGEMRDYYLGPKWVPLTNDGDEAA
jgi:succinate dehydrogenase/fumarate reductase flavoprotein subunit